MESRGRGKGEGANLKTLGQLWGNNEGKIEKEGRKKRGREKELVLLSLIQNSLLFLFS